LKNAIYSIATLFVIALFSRYEIAAAAEHGGYIWVAQPTFCEVGQFYNGHAVVRRDGYFGIINSNGTIVVPIIYNDLGWFGNINVSSGFIEARLGEKWGVLDFRPDFLCRERPNPQKVIPFVHDEILINHHYGMAIVREGQRPNYVSGLVELSTGRTVVPVGTYRRIWGFGEGLAIVSDRRGNHGFICINTGEIAVPLIYGWAHRFSNGLAAVQRSAQRDQGWGFINARGEEVIPFIYEQNTGVSPSGLILTIRNGLRGLMDTNGTYIVPPKYQDIDIFRDTPHDLAIVRRDDRRGLLNIVTGEYIIPPEFATVRLLGENIAALLPWQEQEIQRRGDYPVTFTLFCIRERREISTVTYNFHTGHISAFRGGFSIIATGDGWGDCWRLGLIDTQGNEIIPPIYDSMNHFSDYLLRIDYLGGRFRRQGRLLCKRTWDEVLPWHDFISHPQNGFAIINTGGEWIHYGEWMDEIVGGYWGFIDEYANIIIPPTLDFQRVRPVSEGIAAVQRNDKWGFIAVNLVD